jgi:replicative DNA helicase
LRPEPQIADQLPANLDAEKTILGAILLDDSVFPDVTQALIPGDLMLDSHKRIVRAMKRVQTRGAGIDLVTLGEELKRTREIEAVGGVAYLASLTEGLPRRPRIDDYLQIVKDKSQARQLIQMCTAASARAGEQTELAVQVAADLNREIEHLLELPADEAAGAEIAATIIPTLDKFYAKRKLTTSPGLSFGLTQLDKHTGGMMPGQQTAVGCLPGVGKTNFMAQAILKTLRDGHRVEAFLLEPTRDEITMRLLSLATGVPYKRVLWPWTCPEEDAVRLARAGEELMEMKLAMHDRSNLTLDDVLAIARRGIDKHGTRLICLDYIQRLRVRAEAKDEPLRLRMGRVSTALADLVKNRPCHSLILSQLNTGRKSAAGAIPTMFDFSEAGQIERDAHTIILLHREYGEKEGHFLDKGAIFVPKQRFGSPCNLTAWFDSTSASWTDQDPKVGALLEYADE